MENKINIAELLKDCPEGMELDCTNYNGVVSLKGITNEDVYPIEIQVVYSNECNIHTLTKYGQTVKTPYNKCVIFPKGKTTWEGFQRPFKDGDILYVHASNRWICIYKEGGEKENVCHRYVAATSLIFVHDDDSALCHRNNIKEIRLATEEEKRKLFKAINDNGYRWNAESKTLEKLITPKFKVGNVVRLKSKPNYIYTIHSLTWDDNKKLAYRLLPKNDKHLILVSLDKQDDYELVPNKFDITTLKPFDKVLVRDTDDDMWIAAFFSHLRGTRFYTVSTWYSQCIPFEGNQHLLGTTNDCDDFYKTWK